MNLPFDPTYLSECHVPKERVAELGVLGDLYELLLAANQRDNLTRIVDESDYWIRHVVDSLLIGRAVPEIMNADWWVADVGCGGGFPILPLAWANPKLRMTGIESRRKKVEFVSDAIASLGLPNADAIAMQAREAGRAAKFAESFDAVLLRAVGDAGEMLREVRGLLKQTPGARVIHYKTPDSVVAEIELAEREARKYGFRIDLSDVYELPCGAGTRQFMVMVRV
jgi:16S rRNA (guanine527-N7)-methyltransferase